MANRELPDENILGAVSYLGFWPTGLLLLLLVRDNSYVRFHAMQSLVVFGALQLVFILLGFIPVLGNVISFNIIPPLAFIIWVVLMWKAFNGERYKLPFVGDFAEKQLKKRS